MTEIMRDILVCQFVYVTAALLFNALSWTRVRRGLSPLTATPPAKGLVSMLIVLAVILSWPLLDGLIFLLGWIFLIWRIVPGGIYLHAKRILIDGNPQGYASPFAGILAMSINIFGILAGIAGLIVSFVAFQGV